MSWKRMKRAGVGLSIVVGLGIMVAAAEAAVGTVLETVAIPPALCGGNSGTAVAVVPGGKAGFPNIPVLLVTSCQNQLFFLEPASPAALLKRTLPISVDPTALSARADKGDLLACVGTNSLWAIDFSPLTATADGTATQLRASPAGSNCDGIAWDSGDRTSGKTATIYQTGVDATGANVVFKFGESTIPPNNTVSSVPAGLPRRGRRDWNRCRRNEPLCLVRFHAVHLRR